MPRPKLRTEAPCLWCGTLFEAAPSQRVRGHGKYCSRACWGESQRAPRDHRICNVCKKDKPADQFERNPNCKSRLRSYCLSCRSVYQRNYREKNKRHWLSRRMQRQFGITIERYEELLKQQEGKCAICGGTEPGGNFPRMAIDHDHITGEVRGLLCSLCNTALGAFGDSTQRLQAAIEYLASPPARGLEKQRERYSEAGFRETVD